MVKWEVSLGRTGQVCVGVEDAGVGVGVGVGTEPAAGMAGCCEGPGSTASGPKGKLLLDCPGTDSTAHDHYFFADSPEMPSSLLLLILGHHDCNSSTLEAEA